MAVLRHRQRRPAAAARVELVVVRDDVVADFNALVADEDGRARNELAYVVLILVAERPAENLAVAGLFNHGLPVSSYQLPVRVPSYLETGNRRLETGYEA